MKNTGKDIERRLMVLEEKLEYQDDTVEKLNEVIIAQQHQIDKLEEKLTRLHEIMEAGNQEVGERGTEPLPPHY